MSGSSSARRRSPLASVTWCCVWLAVAIAVVAVFAAVFMPQPATGLATRLPATDESSLLTAVSAERIGAWQERVLSLGSRLVGQPAALETARMIEDAFEEAGLEVLRHVSDSVAPVTERAAFAVGDDAGGFTAVPAVEILPFRPNHLQPASARGAGLVGELVLLDAETLRRRSDFAGVIGVIDGRSGHYDAAFAFDWTRYARLGLAGLVVAAPDGLDGIDWAAASDRLSGMVSSVPAPFLRVAASREIFDHIGRTVRIDLTVRWRSRPNPSVIGVVRAPDPAHEAILVAVNYDADGILPDRAIGAREAMQAALLVQLARGLAPLRDGLRRDVILVATGGSSNGQDGLNHLLRMARVQGRTATGEGEDSYRQRPIREQRETNAAEQQLVRGIVEALADPAFLEDLAVTRAAIADLDRPVRAFLDEQSDFVLQTILKEVSEEELQARLAMERTGLVVDADHPTYAAFRRVMAHAERLHAAAGLTLLRLLETRGDLLAGFDFTGRLRRRMAELDDFHTAEDRRLEQELAITALLDRYREVMVVHPFLALSADSDAPQHLLWSPTFGELPAVATEKHTLLQALAREVAPESPVTVAPLDRQTWWGMRTYVGDSLDPSAVEWWSNKGYECYALATLERPDGFADRVLPVLRPWMTATGSLRETFRVAARLIHSLGRGNTRLQPQQVRGYLIGTYRGRVLLSGLGKSMVPQYPLAGAVVANYGVEGEENYSMPGYCRHGFLITDPYGRYDMPETSSDWPAWPRMWSRNHEPVAAAYDEDGFIAYIKDEGPDTQRLFKSQGLHRLGGKRPVTIVAFRAAPVAIYDLNNPQTMQEYASVRLITAEGLSEFSKFQHASGRGVELFHLEPDRRFYAVFQAGVPGNEHIHQPRAVAMHVEGTPSEELTRAISGRGYLVDAHPILDRVPWRTAAAMQHLNGWRLDIQKRYHMADARTRDYHRRGAEALAESRQPDRPLAESRQAARESVVYASLNHPVLREAITEAVWGILWYLFLMVPFIIFFEKLVFGFTDTRKQVVAQIAIFLCGYALLQWMHPAFAMVRSSLMILLGFLIILIAGGMTVMISGSFSENLENLRKRAGKVAAAEVNTLGVIGSAFMLSLNNMHRRKVRTGLTCGTLVLLTFVMISFTSVTNDLVDERLALGRAHYQGMLVRKDDFQPLTAQEVFAFQEVFSDRYPVSRRALLVGQVPPGRPVTEPPQLILRHQHDGREREAVAHGYLKLDIDEPLRHHLRFVTRCTWFTEADLAAERTPVILSDRLAAALAVDPEAVDAGQATVRIAGVTYTVRAILDSESLLSLRDLDGGDLLPYDLTLIAEVGTDADGRLLVGDAEPRIAADSLILLPFEAAPIAVQDTAEMIASVAVAMPDASYREANEAIESFLVQTGEPLFFGLDGIAYRGHITRRMSLAGLVDLIIPLLIAGLTVLNTMKGSVYERRDEIFIYNAVGIAPRYVFFMFIAEAFVYAVVGSVLGYMLSQGVGRLLTAWDMTGGLRMTYTSLATIYASWTIMAAAFISTIFPARQAMLMAKPAEDAGWKLPEPNDDGTWSFALPFTFRHHDRYAIITFLRRWLEDHGEGSAGRFFAGLPEPVVVDDPQEAGHRIPGITTTIWLKPFDQAVSQRLTITVPVDPATGLYQAQVSLERLSGTQDAWRRLNQGYIRLVRRQFLHWRAVSEGDRREMFELSGLWLRERLAIINAHRQGLEGGDHG